MTTVPLKYVTEDEVSALREGARQTRHKLRNELMVLMLYKHGLRGTELCRITLDQLDLVNGWLFVERIKGGGIGCLTWLLLPAPP
jgi:integrase